MPELNALFEPHEGWIGGDGAHSVALDAQRTLWLFSDTWVGSVRHGKRTNATIVNNTVAIQEGRGKDAKVQFIVRRDDSDKPVAFVAPADRRGWYWLNAGASSGGRLYLFLAQMERAQMEKGRIPALSISAASASGSALWIIRAIRRLRGESRSASCPTRS